MQPAARRVVQHLVDRATDAASRTAAQDRVAHSVAAMMTPAGAVRTMVGNQTRSSSSSPAPACPPAPICTASACLPPNKVENCSAGSAFCLCEFRVRLR